MIFTNGHQIIVDKARRFIKDERGDIVQYLLIIALLIVFFLPDITSLQTSIQGVFTQIGTQLSNL